MDIILSPKDIADAQSSLIDYMKISFKCMGKKFNVKPHHEYIANTLEKVLIGEIQNIIINIPPRHSKTQLLQSFIEWGQGLYADSNTIYTSYSQNLATSVSENIRNNIDTPWFRQIFGEVYVDKSINSKNYWRVQREKEDGSLVAVPSGGQITGRGAGISGCDRYSGALVIDDPIKPQDANSEVERSKVNVFFSETLFSRANNPLVPTIILMQRLHQEDLAGYLLQNQPDVWEHINIPAVNAEGEALWSEIMPIEKLEKLRQLNPRVFMTQYQQEPVSAEGNLFPTDCFTVVEGKPNLENASIVIGTDFAVTSSSDADFTVFSVMAFTADGVYLLDMYRAQSQTDVWVRKLIDMVEKWSPEWVFVESGVIFNAVEPGINSEMNKRKVYCSIKKITRGHRNKVAVAQTMLGLYRTGQFKIHKDCPHINELREEIISFPLGRHDDMVDAIALPCLDYNALAPSSAIDNDLDFSLNPLTY